MKTAPQADKVNKTKVLKICGGGGKMSGSAEIAIIVIAVPRIEGGSRVSYLHLVATVRDMSGALPYADWGREVLSLAPG